MAYSTSFSTAHTIPTNTTSNLTELQQQQQDQTITNATTNPTNSYQNDKITKLLRWIIKLHLSLFYINGKYPTIAHRLVGCTIATKQNSDDDKSSDTALLSSLPAPTTSTIVANRPSYTTIGMLIALQASASLIKTTFQYMIEFMYVLQRIRTRWRKEKEEQRRKAYTTSIEQCVPSVEEESFSTNKTEGEKQQQQSITYVTSTTNTNATATQCGICMNERLHPSAPIACGHVFCWSCIHYWITNVRSECPLCRCHARECDIMALYHYESSPSSL
uniref:RING-type E3 ubiquitin transferase n=2 Tax=Ditylum brightwellii TaxID=49249 RepID=A0A7S4R105_9STRA